MSNNNNTNTTNNNELQSLRAELVTAKQDLAIANNRIQSLQEQWDNEEDAATKHAIMDQLKMWVPDRPALNNKIAALTNRLTTLENPQPPVGM